MSIPANFDTLWANLPQWFNVRKIITNIPQGWETCCIQLSYAMNQSGLSINYGNKNRVLVFKGQEHMLDVKEMRLYLDKKYGTSDNISRVDTNKHVISRIAIQASLDERQGIIAFGNRHIDLWNGSKIHGEHYIPSALWEAASAVTIGIFFWDVSEGTE